MANLAVLTTTLAEGRVGAVTRGGTIPQGPHWLKFGQRFFRRLADRCGASFAVHDHASYMRLVRHVALLVDYRGDLERLAAELRRFDPQGLGVWYLARVAARPTLSDVCRGLFQSRVGPPRAVTRLLEQSLDGRPVCWFGLDGGFHALVAESLLAATIMAALTALTTATTIEVRDWSATLHPLTLTSQALQTTVRAFRRVLGETLVAAEQSVSLAYQSVNIARRAQNRTDLLAVDDRLATEVVRLALESATAACTAALEVSTNRMGGMVSGDGPNKLASLARTLDALLARIAAQLESGTGHTESRSSHTDQLRRALCDLERSLRPWSIQLIPASATARATEDDWRSAATQLLEASAETLEVWAVLHETYRASASRVTVGDESGSEGSGLARMPAWSTQLLAGISGEQTIESLFAALRSLEGPADRAVPGAVTIAAMQGASLRIRRALWKLIRTSSAPDALRRFSFQLFWRLHCPIRERCLS